MFSLDQIGTDFSDGSSTDDISLHIESICQSMNTLSHIIEQKQSQK
jgi:hypothetical protein